MRSCSVRFLCLTTIISFLLPQDNWKRKKRRTRRSCAVTAEISHISRASPTLRTRQQAYFPGADCSDDRLQSCCPDDPNRQAIRESHVQGWPQLYLATLIKTHCSSANSSSSTANSEPLRGNRRASVPIQSVANLSSLWNL